MNLLISSHVAVVGNQHFREFITDSIQRYIKAGNRFDKSLVVHGIVEKIRSAGGRFLKQDSKTRRWYELSEQQSKEKVGHAIRDAASSYEVRLKKKMTADGLPGKIRSMNKARSDSEVSSQEDILDYRQRQFPLPPPVSSNALVAALPADVGLDQSHSFQAETQDHLPIHHMAQPLRPDVHYQGFLPPPAPQLRPNNPVFPRSDLYHDHGQRHLAVHPAYRREIALGNPAEYLEGRGVHQLNFPHQRLLHQGLGNEEKDPGHHHDEHFLDQINDVLGPLPPDAEDPMNGYFPHQRR